MASSPLPADKAKIRGAFDVRAWVSVLVISLFMLWPSAIEGRPSYFFDSLAYERGGKVAIDFLATRVGSLLGSEPAAAPVPAAAQKEAGSTPAGKPATKAARSITYSVIAYLLRAPGQSMLLVAVLQAVSVAVVVFGFIRLTGRRDVVSATIFGAALALLTPAALVANFMMPDIFAGVLIGAIALLAVAPQQWAIGYRLLLVALGALAVSVHTSHPPVALAVAGSAIAAVLLWRRHEPAPLIRVGWIAAPVLLGLFLTTVTGLIGFGEVSVAPKRYPLTLARSIVDGPARLYLQDHCGERHYAICELLGPTYPDDVEKILWGDRGIVKRATPEQLNRIRAEEPEIVWRSALEHPRLQIERYAYNIGRQLITADVLYVKFQKVIAIDDRGTLQLEGASGEPSRSVVVVNAAAMLSVLCSIIFLLYSLRTASPTYRMLFGLIVAGIVSNAVVCAVFSGVTDRYQTRVIWLLPLLALSQAISVNAWAQLRQGRPARAPARTSESPAD